MVVPTTKRPAYELQAAVEALLVRFQLARGLQLLQQLAADPAAELGGLLEQGLPVH